MVRCTNGHKTTCGGQSLVVPESQDGNALWENRKFPISLIDQIVVVVVLLLLLLFSWNISKFLQSHDLVFVNPSAYYTGFLRIF